MPATPLLSAKLQIPPLPSRVVRRPRLVGHLQAVFLHKLTLVSAPPGYGKTTLLASFAAETDVPVVWYTLDQHDNDPVLFFDYLMTGIERQWPGLTGAARELLETPGAAPVEDSAGIAWITTVLLNALGRLEAAAGDGEGAPWLIVLDDYHHIKAEQIHDALALLLRHLPPHLHLMLGTREDPPLPLPVLRARGQLLEIRARDLRFTVEEIDRVLRKGLAAGSRDVDPLNGIDVEGLEARTEGWAVGVQMALTALRERDPQRFSNAMDQVAGSTHTIFDYLTEEVYEDQPAHLRAFLAASAILENMSAGLCDHVLELDSSDNLLRSLERRNLFIFPRDPAHTTYRYHDLFRAFLLRQLSEQETDRDVARLHRRAAAWYLEHGEDERAVEHLLDARDFPAAAELIRASRERLLFRSRVHLLERWLSRFPRDVVEGHPWLLLTEARLAQLRGDRAEATRLFRQAEPKLRQREDRGGLYTVYHRLGQIAMMEGDYECAVDRFWQALDFAVDDTKQAIALGLVARCLYLGEGDTETALRTLDDAVALAARSNQPRERADLLLVEGSILCRTGDFVGALDAWHTALDLMETAGNRHQQTSPLYNAAYLHYLLGELDQGEEMAERALRLAQMFELPMKHAYALNIRGVLHRAQGAWQAARRCHEQALSIQRRINDRYEIPTTLNWLALLARFEGRHREALRLARKGLKLREELDSKYEVGLSLIDLGAIYLTLADTASRPERHLEEAEGAWRRAMAIFTHHEARYEQTQLHLYLAVLAQRQDDEEAMEEHLERATALARTYEHGNSPERRCLRIFTAEAPWVAPLLAEALCRDLVLECVDCLLPRLGKPALQALLPLLDHASAGVRARAARLLGRLGDAAALKMLYVRRKDAAPDVRQAVAWAQRRILKTPPAPLHVETLGGFRLVQGVAERRGRVITDWPRSSARYLFLLLLIAHPQEVPADAVSEALWPGASPDRASSSLRRAVSDLRRTLEPELPPRAGSRYLVTRPETYALRLPAGSFVADVAFEEALSQALSIAADGAEVGETPSRIRSRERAIEALEAAIEQYKGDYLPDVPFEAWAVSRREYLRRRLLRGLHRVASLYLEAKRYDDAVTSAHLALSHEPWDEEAALILMRAHIAQGNIPAVLRVYEDIRERLEADLGINPGDDLTALYQKTRRRPGRKR